MSAIQWVNLVYRRYAQLDGRSTRSEYWWFALFYNVVYFMLAMLAYVVAAYGSQVFTAILGLFSLVFLFGSLVPAWAVLCRRLHDTDRSG